jgi:hypothetical protein
MELESIDLVGGNCVELNCIILGGKMFGTGLYNFGGANFVKLDSIGLGGEILW